MHKRKAYFKRGGDAMVRNCHQTFFRNSVNISDDDNGLSFSTSNTASERSSFTWQKYVTLIKKRDDIIHSWIRQCHLKDLNEIKYLKNKNYLFLYLPETRFYRVRCSPRKSFGEPQEPRRSCLATPEISDSLDTLELLRQ